MAGTDFVIHGVPEFKKFLNVLEGRLQRKVSGAALIASAKPIKLQMRANLAKHRRTGTLYKSIGTVKAKSGLSFKKEVIILVGAIKANNTKFFPGGFYARFLEFGTSKHPPHPWARPAVQSATGAQQKLFGIKFGRRALKEVKRQANKIIGFK